MRAISDIRERRFGWGRWACGPVCSDGQGLRIRLKIVDVRGRLLAAMALPRRRRTSASCRGRSCSSRMERGLRGVLFEQRRVLSGCARLHPVGARPPDLLCAAVPRSPDCRHSIPRKAGWYGKQIMIRRRYPASDGTQDAHHIKGSKVLYSASNSLHSALRTITSAHLDFSHPDTMATAQRNLETFQLGPFTVPRLFNGLWQLSSNAWGTAPVPKIRRHMAQYAEQGYIAFGTHAPSSSTAFCSCCCSFVDMVSVAMPRTPHVISFSPASSDDTLG